MLRYGKSGLATVQPRSPSISGVMPIHPIGSYDRSGALDTTGEKRFPDCSPQASRPTAQYLGEPIRQASPRHDLSSQLELSRRNRATSRSSSPWSLSGQASPTGGLLTPDHVASGGTSFETPAPVTFLGRTLRSSSVGEKRSCCSHSRCPLARIPITCTPLSAPKWTP